MCIFVCIYVHLVFFLWASLLAQLVKNPSAMWGTWVWSLGWEDAVEKGKATHSSILVWRHPWTVESMRSQSQTWLSDFHCLLVKSLSCVWLFATPWTVACEALSVHGIFQARILEWVAISFSRVSSQPMNQTHVSHIASRLFTIWATRKSHICMYVHTSHTSVCNISPWRPIQKEFTMQGLLFRLSLKKEGQIQSKHYITTPFIFLSWSSHISYYKSMQKHFIQSC